MNIGSGTYFDGQTARAQPVSFEFADASVRISGEGFTQEIPLAEVRASERLAHVPRFLYLPQQALLETPDNDLIDYALGHRPQGRLSQVIHRLESQQRIAAGACLLLVAAIAALAFYGPPALARVVARRVPIEIDQRIGTAALTSIAPYFSASALTNAERARVEAQLTRVCQLKPRPRLEFRSMNGGLPNAFALPGNVIVVTDELLRLPATDDEIAAVLAHEVGHLERRHGLQTLLRNSFAVLAVAAVTGDVTALTSFAGAVPLTILTAGYSRDLEREADRYAADVLRVKRIPARAFVTALTKLEGAREALKRNSTYLSTHPATDERTALFGGITAAEKKVVLAERFLERGMRAASRNEHDAAIAEFSEYLKSAPTARAYLLRAQSHLARNDSRAADADAQKAIDLDPTLVAAYQTHVEALATGLRKYDDAIEAARAALALDPKNATVTALRGYAEIMKGNHTAAAADLDKAIALARSDYRGWAYRGLLKQRTKDLNGALADYDEALRFAPTTEWIYQERGSVRLSQRNFNGAMADFAHVTSPNRQTAKLLAERGLALQGLGKLDLAINEYTRALEKKPDQGTRSFIHLNRGMARMALNDPRAALIDFDAAEVANPKNTGVYVQRAQARRRTGNTAGALADLDRAVQGGVPEAAIRRTRAALRWDRGDFDAALQDFDQIIGTKPDAAAFRGRGLVYFSLANWPHAEADLSAAVAAARGRPEDYGEFFQLLARRRGGLKDQTAAFAAAVAKWPDGWPKSVAGYLCGEVTEAELLALAKTGKAPTPKERRCEAYFYIGQMHLIAGESSEADVCFQQCVATGATTFYEYSLAEHELRRMRAAR